jgi:hypothetical protein
LVVGRLLNLVLIGSSRQKNLQKFCEGLMQLRAAREISSVGPIKFISGD